MGSQDCDLTRYGKVNQSCHIQLMAACVTVKSINNSYTASVRVVSFFKLKTAQHHLKVSTSGHLQLHMLYETCQLADAAKEACFIQECFQGLLRWLVWAENVPGFRY